MQRQRLFVAEPSVFIDFRRDVKPQTAHLVTVYRHRATTRLTWTRQWKRESHGSAVRHCDFEAVAQTCSFDEVGEIADSEILFKDFAALHVLQQRPPWHSTHTQRCVVSG